MRQIKKIDLNTILRFGNICICVIGIITYYNVGANIYVNQNTLSMLWLLGGQNIFMLVYEKRKRDPFIIILVLITLIFYMFQIVALLYIPWSLALSGDPFTPITPNDLNYSLQFIIFSNAAIFLGLIIARGKIVYREIGYIEEKPASPFLIIILLSFLIIFNNIVLMKLDILGRIKSFLGALFLNVGLLMFLMVLYLISNFNKITRNNKNAFYIVIMLYILTVTIIGSRSSILTVLEYALFGLLSVKGRVMLSKKHILGGIVLAGLSMVLFVVATEVRQVGYTTSTSISMKRIDAAKESITNVARDVEPLLRPIFNRIGYLAYASDLIKNNEAYRRVINIGYYIKSIVDNALTPGFNIFDAPRASHALRYIHSGISDRPTHKDIQEEYNSSMFTLYGEYFIIFRGYPALIFIFIFSYIFKKIYLSVKKKDVYLFHLYRAIILLIFYRWLNSFGMDWMIIELITIYITVFLFKNLFIMRSKAKNVITFL